LKVEGAAFHPPHFGLVFTGKAVLLGRLAACLQATPGVHGTPTPAKNPPQTIFALQNLHVQINTFIPTMTRESTRACGQCA
jgi:hypothetical protein